MGSEFEKVLQEIIGFQSKFNQFRIDFLDRYAFKDFVDRLSNEVDNSMKELCITGYFSETIRRKLVRIARYCKVKLICPKLTKSSRDIKNLEALQKLSKVGSRN
jgi:hypothetical protein